MRLAKARNGMRWPCAMNGSITMCRCCCWLWPAIAVAAGETRVELAYM